MNKSIYNFVFFNSIKKIKSNIVFLLGVSIMLILIYLMYDMVYTIMKNRGDENILIEMILNFIILITQIGLIKIILNILFDKEVEYLMLFTNVKYFFNYFSATVFYFLGVFIGLLLFIIPGIYFAIIFMFYSYLIVDKNLNFLEALKLSKKMTKKYLWNLFVIWLVINFINFLAVSIHNILVFAIMPFTLIFIASSYIFVYMNFVINKSNNI